MKKRVKMDNRNWENIADIFKSVGHPKRLAILHLICNCDSNQLVVKSIYGTLHLSQSGTSRHLGIMKKCGLLKRESKNGKTFYGPNMQNSTMVCLMELLID
jgi:DNA-binding transcriptional ArsR family regulator